jgi:mono/diheme cytochrome c family protein
MNNGNRVLLGIIALAASACGREEPISFSQNVKPIIDQNCVECHQPGGKGLEASGFNMETYEGLMKGTRFGPMIIGGDSEGSNMIVLMEGRADPSISMPHGSMEPMKQAEIDTIRLWIDQGAQNN